MKLTVVVLLLTGLCLSAPARAQTSEARERARALLAEGAKLFDDGDYEGALGKFEAAHRLVPSPKLYFNIGQAQRSLARDVEALEAFETFVAEAHDAPAERRAGGGGSRGGGHPPERRGARAVARRTGWRLPARGRGGPARAGRAPPARALLRPDRAPRARGRRGDRQADQGGLGRWPLL